MTDPEYYKLIKDAAIRLTRLIATRDETEVEISKLRQFMRATIHMLPDDERYEFEQSLDYFDVRDGLKRASLTDDIRDILERSPKRWFTVAQVRDELRNAGFDFNSYTSNPLSSVSTTLRRMKPNEVETTEINDVIAYRWKNTPANRRKKAERERMEQSMKVLFSNAGPDPEIEAHDERLAAERRNKPESEKQ